MLSALSLGMMGQSSSAAAAAVGQQNSSTFRCQPVCAQEDPTAVPWSDLPQLLLIQALEHVDVAQRCRVCALVCRSWDAAVTATRRACFAPGSIKPEQFQQLLTREEGGPSSPPTTCLELGFRKEDGSCQLQHLPLPKLQSLQLRGFKFDSSTSALPYSQERAPEGFQVQLAACEEHPGILSAAAASLTCLVLDSVVLTGGPAQLQAVAALTALQRLELGWCGHDCDAIPGSILLPLQQQLTHLSLHHSVTADTLQHLSCLRKLQQLKLGLLLPITSAAAASDLAGIGQLQQLTALTIFGAWFPLSRASTPWLMQLPGLLQLRLHGLAGIQPGVLAHSTRLQSLHLRGSLLPDPAVLTAAGAQRTPAPTAPAAARSAPTPAAAASGAAGVAALLAVLPKLRQLAALTLVNVLDQAAPLIAAYSALTASSCLRRLDLSRACIPAAAWQYIFPACRRQPCLLQLRLDGVDGGFAALPAAACAFPALQQLSLTGCGSAGSRRAWQRQLGALREMHCLTSLSAQGPAVELCRAAAVLTQLQQLTLKFVEDRPQLACLLRLTALRQLETCSVAPSLLINNKAPWGSPPDVWSQLQQHCSKQSSEDVAPAPSASKTGAEVDG